MNDKALSKYLKQSGDALPKYQRLRNAIIAAIDGGRLREGSRIPGETELIEISGFSLGTVQRAIRMLADEGIVSRRQGSGSFISTNHSRIPEPWHFCFLDSDDVTPLPAYPKVIRRTPTADRGAWSRFLGQRRDNILRIDRVVNVNDEFLIYSKFYVDRERLPIFEETPIEKLHSENFRALISGKGGLPITLITHRVLLSRLDAEVSRHIKKKNGSPVLVLEILAQSGRDQPLYFQEILIPPSIRKLLLPSVGRIMN